MKHYFVLGMIFLLLLFTRIGQAQERLDLSAQIPIVAWYGIRQMKRPLSVSRN